MQTAAIVSDVLKLKPPEVLDGLSPGSSARRLLDGLANLEAETPLLVGHEPLLSSAVLLAITGAPMGSIELKKAGLAVVEIESGSARVRGMLTLLLSGAALRKLG
jgi:phosphohistidine phosphatase SixA